MKKLLTIFAVVLLIACSIIAMVGCTGYTMIVGKEFVEADAQLDILTELNAKTSDIGVMDSVMADYYLETEAGANLQKIEDCVLAEENYGIAGRKNSGFINVINNALIELAKSGEVNTIAEKYELADKVVIDTTKTFEVDKDDEDYKLIMGNKVLIIGYTEFAPIAFNSKNGLTGFDIELAKIVAEKIGLEVEFKEIDWDTKELELNTKKIDLIWNGFTINEERKAAMKMSIPYMLNKQVAIIRKSDAKIYTKDTLTWAEATMTAEAGSAGQDCIIKEK